jgi:allantoin racemase
MESVLRGQLAAADFAPDLQFDFKLARLTAPTWNNHHDFLISDFATFELGLDAERDGYDAVCIETITDGGYEALRAALDIPVLSAGHASYLTALLLGRRFSIIVVWDGFKLAHERSLRQADLLDRCASIRDLGMGPGDVSFANMFGGREDTYYPLMAEVGLKCVEEDGADVVILGSTTMYKAAPYLAEHLPVPVVEPAAALYKQTETILGLHLTHSRNAYAKAPTLKTDAVHAMLDAVDELGAASP